MYIYKHCYISKCMGLNAQPYSEECMHTCLHVPCRDLQTSNHANIERGMHTFTYTSVHPYLNIYTCTYTYMQFTNTPTDKSIHIKMPACIYMHIHANINTDMLLVIIDQFMGPFK